MRIAIVIIFAALFWTLFFYVLAFAEQPYKKMVIRFVVLDGPYSLTPEQERLTEAVAERKWRQIGYRFQKHATLRLPFFQSNPKLEEIGVNFDAMRGYVIERLGSSRPRYTHIISPPLIDKGGVLYMAGRAEKIGGGISWSVGEAANLEGEDRMPHSAIAVAHEIGHLAGMYHDDSTPPNIMNSAALQFVNGFPNMGFSRWSQKQINLFLRDRK